MPSEISVEFEAQIEQIEARMGGYTVVRVLPQHFDPLPSGRKTRILCSLNGSPPWHCGINPLGNGEGYVILSAARLKELGVHLGEFVEMRIEPDLSKYGAPVPEVVEALLEQDDLFARQFEALTPGGKRSLIFALGRIKDIDRKIAFAYAYFDEKPKRGRA